MSIEDSTPHISIDALMKAEEEEATGMPVASSSSAFMTRPRELRPASPVDLQKYDALLAAAQDLPGPRRIELHQELLGTRLEDVDHIRALFSTLYAADHAAVVKMWRQIDARDIPRRHILLPLIISRALHAREQVQSAALQAGEQLAHPVICQVAERMFERSSHRVRISAVQVMHTLGDRSQHYFLSQRLEHEEDLDSALVTAIRRALAAIEARHPISATEAGALSLSSSAETGALSLAGQAHEPRLDEMLEAQIIDELDTTRVELIEAPARAGALVSSSHDPGFLALKDQEHAQLRVIRTVLYNEYTNWKMSVAAMAATLIFQFVSTILYQPFFTLAILGLLPMLYDRKIRHADALRQIVLGDRIACTTLEIPERSTMATAVFEDEEGTPHKRYFPLSSSLRQELQQDPDRPVHVAWHPEQEDAYLVESYGYLTLDEHGSLALAGRSKAWLVRSLAVLNFAAYGVCMAFFDHSIMSTSSMLTVEAISLGVILMFGFAIQYNRQTNSGRFTL